MKRSNQNIFMPFTVGGIHVMKRFTNKRKTTLLESFSNSDRTIEDVNFKQESSTKTDTDFYTTFDLDIKEAVFVSKTKSDPEFVFDATVVDRTDCTIQEPIFNKEKPIISTHWAEVSDHDSLIDQKPEAKKEPIIMDKLPADDNRDYKPYLWFI